MLDPNSIVHPIATASPRKNALIIYLPVVELRPNCMGTRAAACGSLNIIVLFVSASHEGFQSGAGAFGVAAVPDSYGSGYVC